MSAKANGNEDYEDYDYDAEEIDYSDIEAKSAFTASASPLNPRLQGLHLSQIPCAL